MQHQHLLRIAVVAVTLMATSSFILVSGDEEGARAILVKYTSSTTKLNEIRPISKGTEGKCVCVKSPTLELLDCGMGMTTNLNCLWLQVPVGTIGEAKFVSVGQKKAMQPTIGGNGVGVVEWQHASQAQLWLLSSSNGAQTIRSSSTSKCIELKSPTGDIIILNDCSSSNALQSWRITEEQAKPIDWVIIVRGLLELVPNLRR